MASLLSITPTSPTLTADYRAGAVFGPRMVPSHEFIWLLEGSARWHWSRADDHQVLLRPGRLALATVGMRDRLDWDPDRPSRHAYVHFQVTGGETLPPVEDWPDVRDLTAHPVLQGLCDYLLDLGTLADEIAVRRTGEVLALLLRVFVEGPFRGTDPVLDRHLTAVVDHVRIAWQHRLRIVSVAEIAAVAGISAGHLHRIFRDHFGCGPARALELIRLASAASALQRSNATIAEIAEATGFPNPYHFSRRFSGCYRVPPGAYRRSDADPYEPLRHAGLLPIAHRLLKS